MAGRAMAMWLLPCGFSGAEGLTHEGSIVMKQPVYVEVRPGSLIVSQAECRSLRVLVPGEEPADLGKVHSATGLALSGDGQSLYVGQQQGNGLIKMRLADGVVVADAGRMRGSGRPGDWIESALGVAVGGGGNVYVADVTRYRLTAYDQISLGRVWQVDQSNISGEARHASGCAIKRLKVAGPYEGPSCFNPHGVAWSPAFGGRIYVTDADNRWLLVFSEAGELMRTISEPFVAPVRGVAVTPSGRLLICEPRRLLLLSLVGKVLETLEVPGAANMLGVAANASHAFVADVGADRVHVIHLWSLRTDNSALARERELRATS